MIINNLHIDDDLITHYQDEAVERKVELNDLLADRLRRALQLDPRHRYIIVADAARDTLERLLGGGTLRDGQDLLQKVHRQARIGMGDHELELTPGQMEEIVWRARKQGKEPAALVKEAWDRFCADFFTLVR